MSMPAMTAKMTVDSRRVDLDKQHQDDDTWCDLGQSIGGGNEIRPDNHFDPVGHLVDYADSLRSFAISGGATLAYARGPDIIVDLVHLPVDIFEVPAVVLKTMVHGPVEVPDMCPRTRPVPHQ